MSPSPGGGLTAVLRILWRTQWRYWLTWILVLAVSMTATAAGVAGLYDTPAKIHTYAAAVTAGSALAAINGRVPGIDSLGGVIADEFGFLAAFLLPLLGIGLVARTTRGEEATGRLEILLGGRIARRQPVLGALVAAAGVISTTAILLAAGLAANGVPVSGSVLYAASLGALAFAFAGLAALIAQLVPHSRGVHAGGLIVLATAYLLRGIGDVTGSWVTWLSPLGWAEKAAPFGAQHWWALAMPLVTGGLLSVAAARLAGRRDLGSALVRTGAGPRRATRWLRTPAGFALRLDRPGLAGWLAGAVIFAAMMGSLARQLVDALEGNPTVATALGIRGHGLLDGVAAVTQLYLAVIATGYAVASIGTLRGEEAAGRLETRLSGTLSRRRWLAAHTLTTLGGLVLLALVGSLVLGLTAAWSLGNADGFGRVVVAGLAYLPAEILPAALALAAFGLRSRAFPLAWAAYATTAFVALLGPGLKLSRWILDLAPTTHIGNPPLGDVPASAVVVLGAIAVALVGAGFLAFRRRDIPQG